MAPPNEKPAKRSGASPGNIATTSSCTSSRYAGPVVSRATDAESPYEG